MRPEHPEATRELGCAQLAWQLEQRERVAAGLRDYPVADALIQHEPHRGVEQRAGVGVAQTAHLELGHVLKLLARFARGEHDPDRFGQQPSRHEGQRQRRGVIQPLRVIDNAQNRTLLGSLRQQAQNGQPDHEPVRRRAGAQPENDFERLALWAREPLEAIECRRAQLMQAGEGQLHLRLHAPRPDNGQVRGGLDQVIQ